MTEAITPLYLKPIAENECPHHTLELSESTSSAKGWFQLVVQKNNDSFRLLTSGCVRGIFAWRMRPLWVRPPV